MNIQVSQLSNGLRVITDRMAAVETVALGMWVNAGSRCESVANNGVAHFLEHMAFKGTTSRSAAEIAQCIERVGGYMNAATSREITAYYMRLLHQDVPIGMEILGDILLNSTFRDAELECERNVILQELRMTLDTPDELIFDYYQQTAFQNQSLGKTILGSADNIKSFQKNDLRRFMGDHYACERMVLTVSGHVNHEQIVQCAEKFLKDLPTHCPRQEPEKGQYTGGDKVVTKDLEQLHLILGFQGIPVTDANYYALSVLTAILGGGMSSRLFQQIREKLGLVYTIYAFKACYTDTGTVGIYAGTGAEEVKKLIPALTDEIKKICEPVLAAELDRAKAQLRAGLMMGLESTTNRCEYLAHQVLFHGRLLSTEHVLECIESVTAAQLAALAQQVFSSDITLSALGPTHNLYPFESIAQRLR